MNFLSIDDFKTVCDHQTLTVIDQNDSSNLDRAESYAIEEVASYLRTRYDVSATFSKSGDQRNGYLVMIVADVALYHLVSWLPKRIGFDTRETRYNQAITWLKDVQSGKATPDLPTPTDPDTGKETSQPVRYGGWGKSEYQY
ncbi:MAG: DUF1320 domain-containing protein [Bacteroidales bacterium]|nr:DUF1320 domain-containing protein [Bacteroidales bacterium]